jgi:hypothetical protein
MAPPAQGRAMSRPGSQAWSQVSAALRPVAGFARRRPGFILGAVALLGCTGAVGWNATHQANRHPAPLFRPKPAVEAPAPRRVEAAIPAPPAIPIPAPRPDPTTVGSVPSAPVPPAQKASASGSDPIGNLIRGSEPAQRSAAEIRPDARVMAVQKALTKLGYGPLKPDGFLGAGTRQALERFERDQSLPVTGGLGTRTTRQLASRSGTQIE